MNENTENNKRIAKNTLLLYIRMLFLMGISLYTSRIVLSALGVDDFGIYNVVGGVVAMFTMISGALSAAISRFITYELGTKNFDNLKKVFSSSVTVQIGLTIILIILAETIGLWFVNHKIIIPEQRIVAANWVYQFSIFTFAINLISIPYNAAIIAHEKMSTFAYISIFEGISKLIIALTIVATPIDKLIFYAFSLMLVSIIVRFIYGTYCKRHFQECTYQFSYDSNLLKKIFTFAGWNMIGATSAVCRDQGGNIIINLFFGPAINAARGIAIQVNTAIQGFVENFQIALNPQITKNYAAGNSNQVYKLVFQGARFSFYILLLIALPVFINANYILYIWLKEVPAHTENFLRLIILFSLCESLSGTLKTLMYATGNVRNYQIVVGGLQLLNLPLSYFCLKFGFPSEIVFIIAIWISLLCMLARLFMLRFQANLSVMFFLKNVLLNTFFVTLTAIILPYILSKIMPISFLNFILLCTISFISTITTILFVGCTKDERKVVYDKIKNLYNKISI